MATTSIQPETQIVHTIEVRHGVTLQPIHPLDVRLEKDNFHWRVKQANNWVVLSTDRDSLQRLPLKSHLSIKARSPEQQKVFANQGAFDVVLDNASAIAGLSTGSKLQIDLPPTDMTLLLSLVNVDGEAITGRTVFAVDNKGAAKRTLRETNDEPGLYRSETEAWGEDFFAFTLEVDAKEIGKKSMDYSRTVTRLRQVLDLEPN